MKLFVFWKRIAVAGGFLEAPNRAAFASGRTLGGRAAYEASVLAPGSGVLPGTFCTRQKVLLGVFITALLLPAGSQAQHLSPALPDWSKLRAFYQYDSSKPSSVEERSESDASVYRLHLAFSNGSGTPVPGLFLRPKAEKPYPCVLLLHGLTSDKETMIKYFGMPLVARGFAVLALDAPNHGERHKQIDPKDFNRMFDATVHDGCLDYRRALDYLTTRKDVDAKRIGLLGYSMGAMMGSILGAVDNRIQDCVLCVGGDPVLPFLANMPEMARGSAYAVCPSLYIGHISPRPILMLNGKQDTTMPKAASQRLYDAARRPKQQLWYDSGHILPPPAGEKAVAWLTAKLQAGRH